jgi:hypothetical protein
MVGSDSAIIRVLDRDYTKLQQTIFNHGVTTHIIVMTGGMGGANAASNTSGGPQTEIGVRLTKLSGGRYESIGAATRLATLLPELGKQIAASAARQSHQYRITYERPANPKAQPQIAASVRREGNVELSLHGNLP